VIIIRDMKRIPLAILLAASVSLIELAAQTAAAGDHWVATWGTAQQLFRAPATGRGQAPGAATPAPPLPQSVPPPAPAAASVAPSSSGTGAGRQGGGGPQRRFGIPASLPGLKNQTVRMILRTSIGGGRVRVRLFNALGGSTVTIGSAHIGLRSSGAGVVPGSDRVLTFSGQAAARMNAGQTLISDPVALQVKPMADVAVSLYFPGETGAPTSHTFGLRPSYVSKEGDFSAAADLAQIDSTMESYYWLAGVDVAAPADAATIVTFGDSITDGDQSTPDTSGMWPALLSARLQANPRTAHVGVVNEGISGNRLLGDNNSGVARLVPHALTVPGVKWLTLLEGINDITGATRPGAGAPQVPFTAEDLITGYRQVIEMAHLQGVKVAGCTLTPFGGSNVFTEAGEAIRQKANDWIRTSGAFDAVIDFDAATRDPADPTRFRPEADSPDMLHPGDAGYKLMANAVDLSLFARTRDSRPKR
jgi:lysophospholipase L1-like esterase